MTCKQTFVSLYHLMGNGTGEWKVPVGGMGALVEELIRVSNRNLGVEIKVEFKSCFSGQRYNQV